MGSMIRDSNLRWFIINNEIHGSFMNYVVIIKPFFLENKRNEPTLLYNLIFTKGNYKSASCISITCETLEKAFESINKYSQYKMFDEVVKQIRYDYLDSAILKTFDEFE